MKIVAGIIAIIALCSLSALADPSGKKLPIPRFVSIKFNEVNAHTGPAKDCPVEWVYVKKGEPVEIVAEYEAWRKIRDNDGQGGWVHANTVSGNRTVIISEKLTVDLLSSPEKYDQVIAKIDGAYRCALKKCQAYWCKVNCALGENQYTGWVPKKSLWGVYPEE